MKIRFHDNTAMKFINKQPPKQKERIMAAIKALPEGDVKPMANKPGIYRLRVGDYRFTYSLDYKNDEIIIRTAGNRGDVYK